MPALSPEQKEIVEKEVRLLGETLEARADQVLELVVGRTREAKGELEASVDASLERICTIATIAVAQWMSGGNPQDGLDASREAFELFGQLAAHRDAPLDEVTKRCLRWRDSVGDVLRKAAAETGISELARRRALSMTQITLDVTLVRMCEVFEAERIRMDDELVSRREELAFMATHDQLTGLPNRTLIIDRAEQMLGRARRNQTPVAALHVNLDNFTAVNDTLGHAAGDELLRAIAARLDGLVRNTDALGRLGGDEFVVIAEETSLAAGAQLIAERLQEALRASFTVGGTELTVTASIGVATGGRASAEELLSDAEIATHRAKREGKNRCVVFESGMQDVVQRQIALEMDLRSSARPRGVLPRLPADLRPAGDGPDGRRDADPLALPDPRGGPAQRLHPPPRGDRPDRPRRQVGARTGLPAGRRMASCGAPDRRRRQRLGPSARQRRVRRPTCEAAIAQSGLDPRALTLEITETALMRNAEETARRLYAIKELGVRIAIDDFGTGYSSLSHLQRFPVDALKIDRSFLSQLAENPEGETLIRTLVQLGKALSIETLAEGIERRQELTLLQEENCDSGQGYLFARPLEVKDAEEFLRNWRFDSTELSEQTAPSPG